jgi:hypothetical protein
MCVCARERAPPYANDVTHAHAHTRALHSLPLSLSVRRSLSLSLWLSYIHTYAGNDMGLPLESMMAATAEVLQSHPLLARTRKVHAHAGTGTGTGT